MKKTLALVLCILLASSFLFAQGTKETAAKPAAKSDKKRADVKTEAKDAAKAGTIEKGDAPAKK